jgi:hypothetical protein
MARARAVEHIRSNLHVCGGTTGGRGLHDRLIDDVRLLDDDLVDESFLGVSRSGFRGVMGAAYRVVMFITFLLGAVAGYLIPGFPPMDGVDRIDGGPQKGNPRRVTSR